MKDYCVLYLRVVSESRSEGSMLTILEEHGELKAR